MNRSIRRIALVAGSATLVAALAGPALSSTSTVTLADVAGSRTLTVTDATGASLDAATISTGAGATLPFVTNVTDVLYGNLPYSVSASLSNLYLKTAGGHDCGVYVPAGDLSIAWPTEAFGVDDVEALLKGILFDLSGTLVSTGNATLDGILTTAGLTIGGPVSATDLTRAGQGLVQTTVEDVTLASLVDLLDLPLAISVGSAGAFGSPADHSVCDGGANDPTAITLQAGAANGTFSLARIADALATAFPNTRSLVDAGLLSEGEIVGGLFTDAQLTQIQTAVATLGLGAVWDAYVQSLVTSLTRTIEVPVGSLIGQTGTYVSVPSLVVADDLRVAGTPPAGLVNLYEGEMVITLSSQ